MQLDTVQSGSSHNKHRIYVLNSTLSGVDIYDNQLHFVHHFHTLEDFLRLHPFEDNNLFLLTGPVPPGTSERLQKRINLIKPESGFRIKVVYCPFLVEEMNVRQKNNDWPLLRYHVLGGGEFYTLHIARRWLLGIISPEQTPLLTTSYKEAELICHTRNIMNLEQQKIFSMLWQRCLSEKADFITILRTIKMGSDLYTIQMEGRLPPIPHSLHRTCDTNVRNWLENQLLQMFSLESVINKPINVMVWSHPDNIPILQKWIIHFFKNRLVNKAYLRIRVWPIKYSPGKQTLHTGSGHSPKGSLLSGSDLLIIAGSHQTLQKLHPKTFVQEMRNPRIIDLYGIYHPFEMKRRGIQYVSPGNS